MLIYGILFINVVLADIANYPFPQGVTYPYGLKPNNYTQAQMNQHVQQWWDKWRVKYLTQTNCGPGEWRVQRTETGNSIHKGCSENDTVSEGIAYGMIVVVYMSSATNNTKQYFDGMWRYYSNRLNANGLMNWQHPYCDSAGSATDADQDVVQALIMADRQWGSGGAINYRNEAIALAARVLQHQITASNDVRPGDMWDGGNPSYFSPYGYRMFGDYTGVTRWYNVARRTYETIVNYYYNSNLTFNTQLGIHTGLQPNWCNYDGTPWSPGAWAMRADTWWWDAIRHAWRQGYDYVLYGTLNHQLAYDNSVRVSNFFKTKYNGDPSLIRSHYELDGRATRFCRGDRTPDLCNEDDMNLPGPVGAVAIAAMAGDDQEWLNALYHRLVTMDAGNGPGELTDTGVMWGTDYFCDLLKMQYLLILTGNMPNPLGNYPSPTPTNTWNVLTPTLTPTPIPPPGLFDNFEGGVLRNPNTSQSGGGASATITNTTADRFEGLRSMQINTAGSSGWAVIQIDSPNDQGLGYRNYTGATRVEFSIRGPAGTGYFIQLEEANSNNGDGERFSNRGSPLSISGTTWQNVSIPLSSLTRDQHTPVFGDNTLDLQAIKSFLVQFDNPGTRTIYIDNINFTGNFPTHTPTRTATRTRTPVGTPTMTPSATRTPTNTPFQTPTVTRTHTSTQTSTPYFSPTITQTPTTTPSIPFGVFENFETGTLESPDQSADGCVPAYSNSAVNPRNGLRSLLIPFAPCAPGGWGSYVAVGSSYNTAVDPNFWISFAGATQITFWINAPAGTVFFLKIEEWDSGLGGANSDGEDFASASITKAAAGWQQYTINLSTFTQYDFSGRQGGNAVLNLSNIDRVGFQFNGGTTGPVYIDDIVFLGMPTPTSTRTFTRTHTPSLTPVLTATFTATSTATATRTAMPTSTATATATMTSTIAQSPTFTATLTGTVPPVPSATPSFTGTATRTGTPLSTATVTATQTTDTGPSHTATATFTRTSVVTHTFTVTVTATATRTATLTATPTFTDTALPTPSGTHTATETISPTHSVSPTATFSPTGTPPTVTVTPTVTQTNTATPTLTTTATLTATTTATLTATAENTSTPLPSMTATAINTDTATITPSRTATPTFSATSTLSITPTATGTTPAAHSPSHTVTAVNTFTTTVTATPTAQIIGNTPTPTVLITFDLRVIKGEVAPSVIIPGTSLVVVDYNVTRNCDSVKFKLFTKSYRKVAEVLIASPQAAGGFRKEIPVSTFSGLAPGAYIYIIEAKGDGYRAISRAGVITVIR